MKRSFRISNIPSRLRNTLSEYPKELWILLSATLINSAGISLVFPFISLYIRTQYKIPVSFIGGLLAAMSWSGIISGIITGYLADNFGRKKIMLLGLILASITSLLLGVVKLLPIVFVLALLFGFLYPMYGPLGPISQAIIADMVGSKKRMKAYSIMRVVTNLGHAIGPAVGGFLAEKSYAFLFIGNAITSFTFSLLILFFIKETNPNEDRKVKKQQAKGYGPLLRDKTFVLFWLVSVLVISVYAQSTTTLPVYMKENYNILEHQYGIMMTINAVMVILFQIPIILLSQKFAPKNMLAFGSLLYAIGFGLTGFVTRFPLFVVAVIIWTFGELIHIPVSQTFAANSAPSDMRARYLGAFGLTFNIGWGVGPLTAGLIADLLSPRSVWHACIAVGIVAAFLFYFIKLLEKWCVPNKKRHGERAEKEK